MLRAFATLMWCRCEIRASSTAFLTWRHSSSKAVALDQKLQLEGRLDFATTVGICAQVADGLQALWEAGMVHRDVKPGNILLDLAGNAYITDFGLAKDSDGTVLTRPGQPLGSMDYMPPEQIRGEPVTGAADIYSLGCVVFECLRTDPVRAIARGCVCSGPTSRTSLRIRAPSERTFWPGSQHA